MISKEGVPSVSVRDFLDIVSIGGRAEIEDEFMWKQYEPEPCAAIQYCVHTIGFDDGQNEYDDPGGADVRQEDVMRILTTMRGPKAKFIRSYKFLNKAKCCFAVRKLMEWGELSDGETLTIEGVGSWSR